MKDIDPELSRIRLQCDNAHEDAHEDPSSAITELAFAVSSLVDLVERLHQSLNNRR